jgi:hypothetical protein
VSRIFASLAAVFRLLRNGIHSVGNIYPALRIPSGIDGIA